MIAEQDLELFQFADDVDTAFHLLETGLTKYYLEPDKEVPGDRQIASLTHPCANASTNCSSWLGRSGRRLPGVRAVVPGVAILVPRSILRPIAFLALLISGMVMAVEYSAPHSRRSSSGAYATACW